MRLGLALACALPLAGCSLIYNPNNIDKPDPDALQAIDAEMIADANPAAMTVTGVATPVIYEGQGVDGSTRAAIVITGEEFVPGASVQLLDVATDQAVGSLVVGDATETEVAANHKMLAVPVTANIDANDVDIRLYVRVTENANGDMIVSDFGKTGDAVLTLRGLESIDDNTKDLTIDTGALAPGGAVVVEKVYAKVNARKLIATGKNPLKIRSISSFSLADKLDVAGLGTAAGVGGGAGGASGGTSGTAPSGMGPCPGTGGAAKALGLGAGTAGTSAGFATPATGGTCVIDDANLTEVAKNVSSGGGGGGGYPGAIGTGIGSASGGSGGGGGGTLQIDAGSTLTLANGATANGAPGMAGVTNTGGGGSGSGGAFLLRSRGALAAGAVTATGGTNAGEGRIRYDSGVQAVMIMPTPGGAHRGAALESLPAIIKTPLPTLKVFGVPGAQVKVTIDGFQNDGSSSHKTVPVELGDDGTNAVTLGDGQNLSRGMNTVCTILEGVTTSPPPDDARDCIEVVYILQNGQ